RRRQPAGKRCQTLRHRERSPRSTAARRIFDLPAGARPEPQALERVETREQTRKREGKWSVFAQLDDARSIGPRSQVRGEKAPVLAREKQRKKADHVERELADVEKGGKADVHERQHRHGGSPQPARSDGAKEHDRSSVLEPDGDVGEKARYSKADVVAQPPTEPGDHSFLVKDIVNGQPPPPCPPMLVDGIEVINDRQLKQKSEVSERS